MKNNLFPIHDLNTEQQQAVEATEGPVLVLAGAGSGKTRVLTYRIAYLLHNQKAKPWEILAMTFTNKAAGEMKERVHQFVPKDDILWIGTFHSIFARILRTESDSFGYPSSYVIYDTDDQKRLVKSVMEDLQISAQLYNPSSILSIISKAKNALVSPDAFQKSAVSQMEQIAARIYPVYQGRLRRNYAFDFDDLITVPIELFEKNPQILTKYQNKFRYVLVDEYQDTNRAQYQLVHYLTMEHKNICVVGDDDQSIYRWRGADIRNILEFEKDYKSTRIFRLEQNYRSTQNILKAANSIVQNNLGRKIKKLWTEREPGEKIDQIQLEDERQEAEKVVEKIRAEGIQKKRDFKDFAILYRTNAQSRVLEEGLRRNGIRYTIVGGVRFYERKEIKDILAYLKLIINPNDDVSLMRIINFPPRGIGQVTFQKLSQGAASQNLTLLQSMEKVDQIEGLGARAKNALKGFHALITKYMGLKDTFSLPELVHSLVDEVELIAMYKEDSTPEGMGRIENIREFLSAVSDYAKMTEDAGLEGFLTEVSLMTDMDAWDDRSNAVTLMTLHCAKGLEFPVVFITGLEEGLFPITRSFEDTDSLEEERRLFYVGLTRAKDKIYLCHARTRSLYGEGSYRMPSRFLDELDPEVVKIKKSAFGRSFSPVSDRRKTGSMVQTHPDYASFSQEDSELLPGLRIFHATFGKGQIVKIEGRGQMQKVIVRFDDGLEKKFLSQYAQFSII